MSELLIVGGGIMGLWAAVMAGRAGIGTCLVERRSIGAGASGGLLGALMPHMPDRWNAKKQFQFDALVALEDEIAELQRATGLSADYRRCGRIMPLAKPHLREIALDHERDAARHWIAGVRRFHWHVRDVDSDCDWPASEAASFGIIHDTLAARVAPRRLVQLLRTALAQFPHVRVEEGAEVVSLDPQHGRLLLAGEREMSFGHCILSAGVECFGLIDRLAHSAQAPSGGAVKGQAALLRADIDPASPIIFTDGLYIVAHEDGHVAIGSTSENRFDEPYSTDNQLDALIRRAEALAPALRGARVIERWAGLRPKATGREPIVGRHPDHDNLSVLTGGFKVSFGIAHALARFVIDDIIGRPTVALPESFACAHHMAALRQQGRSRPEGAP
ncbi:NAD(P)/FAD-dependent oxidoreductase [Sinorhizobium terangae]|uniref:FAD-dependent oxidoreductase n=1 Tax=Sinorhizobium terangae TaxID=110322 RepID=A0A6N7LBT2_SINTE|nr:FAD-binding oxidoreductase [Sinorhizobium terangae]MBB4188348.1 glycine/D-amino acid oxidase-like deaminating enzyme [Sinorhizobium terangae]MQX15301.1 FAD-dependent oxidoreductase [Sinorhizobium terangae]WFU46650.1 FAD-binding oxidoreductase [Sinorhizobium terangae]